MPIAIASSSDSNFSSDFSSDSSEDSLRSSDSDAIYTDDEGSDSDDDFGQEDGSDPLKLATEGFRLVHMRKFGKLVHNTIPCAQCREQRRADLEAVIRGTKRPTKTNLREAADALFNTPTMQIVGEKHNGLASAITFACPECACERTFKTSPSFVPYKFSGVLNDVPLKAADADDGIVYDGDSEDSGASGGGNGSDDDDSDAEDNDAGEPIWPHAKESAECGEEAGQSEGQGEEEQCRCARRSATESTLQESVRQILFGNIEGSVGQARE